MLNMHFSCFNGKIPFIFRHGLSHYGDFFKNFNKKLNNVYYVLKLSKHSYCNLQDF